MNYLDVVNNVLRRIREDVVLSVSSSTYSEMIGALVNDAKRSVEQAWDWEALRRKITVNTVASTGTYSLTGSNDDCKIIQVLDTSNNRTLVFQSRQWIEQQKNTGSSTEGEPMYYCAAGIDSNGDVEVMLYPTPDDAYVITFEGIYRQDDLEQDTDNMLVPWSPVVQLSVALATRERGETGGTSAAEYFAIADKFLSDAIALDANRRSDELIFRTV